MSKHKVAAKTISMPDGSTITIKYWADSTKIYAAAFNSNDKRVSANIYAADADLADGFDAAFHQSLIDGLVTHIETDLKTNPDIHYRP
jgi:hypothetical protein